ncbi:hypothetical protein KAR91_37230 [Candidatus Pacearchaeota archaeon]|nr:hypothetical protein [Candidatus Pacearchaeota archaeon]
MENKGHALEEQPDGSIIPVEITFLNDVSKTTSELMDKEIGIFLSLKGVTVDLLKDPEVSKRGTFERHLDGTVCFVWDGKKVLKFNPPSTGESVLTFDCVRLYLLDSKQAAETFTADKLAPQQVELSACEAGIKAHSDGISSEDNPYDETDLRWDEWEDGWHLAAKKLSPQQGEFYNATLGVPYVPEVVTINVLVHGAVQEWTAYPFDNKGPETLTVKNHHDFASDVSLVFNVETRELVDFGKFGFLQNAKWVD